MIRTAISDLIESKELIFNDNKEISSRLVVLPDTFEYSHLDASKIFRFEVFLYSNEKIIERSNVAIHLANPEKGEFVLLEIKGMKVPWKTITQAILITYDKHGGKISEKEIWFDGLKEQPRRCILINDNTISRCYVSWNVL